jgi:hypothetical protein
MMKTCPSASSCRAAKNQSCRYQPTNTWMQRCRRSTPPQTTRACRGAACETTRCNIRGNFSNRCDAAACDHTTVGHLCGESWRGARRPATNSSTRRRTGRARPAATLQRSHAVHQMQPGTEHLRAQPDAPVNVRACPARPTPARTRPVRTSCSREGRRESPAAWQSRNRRTPRAAPVQAHDKNKQTSRRKHTAEREPEHARR